MAMNRSLKTALAVAVGAAAGVAIATFLVRDQIERHRRNLFSPQAFRRLAALQHMARIPPSVDDINLLRDFISWERRPMLRSRAQSIVRRMESLAESVQGAVAGGSR
jgi:hypothetical protein